MKKYNVDFLVSHKNLGSITIEDIETSEIFLNFIDVMTGDFAFEDISVGNITIIPYAMLATTIEGAFIFPTTQLYLTLKDIFDLSHKIPMQVDPFNNIASLIAYIDVVTPQMIQLYGSTTYVDAMQNMDVDFKKYYGSDSLTYLEKALIESKFTGLLQYIRDFYEFLYGNGATVDSIRDIDGRLKCVIKVNDIILGETHVCEQFGYLISEIPPERPTTPNEGDSLTILVDKVRETNEYIDYLRLESIKISNEIAELFY